MSGVDGTGQYRAAAERSESIRDEVSRLAQWVWDVRNRLPCPVRVDLGRGVVGFGCIGRSASAGRLMLLDLADGSVVKSMAYPGYPSSLVFLKDRLVVRAKNKIDVLDLNRDLTRLHRFGSTGDAGPLVVVDEHTLLAVGNNDALFLDLETHATTKRRPGKWLQVLDAPFGPLVCGDDGRLWRPLSNHTFVRFGELAGRLALTWIDNEGRLWVSRDKPDDRWTPSGEHLDVYTVTANGITLDWTRPMDPESTLLRRTDDVWLSDRSGRVVQPTPDGDEEIGGDSLLAYTLTGNATPNFNIVSGTVGVLSALTDCDSYVARLA